MKWRGLRKYLPPACTYVFIRALSIEAYDRHFVAMIEDFDRRFDLGVWEMANWPELYGINTADYTVTHFAIIDPIEIEE